MKRCKTCKHWQKPDSNYGEIPGSGKCRAAVQFWDATEWAGYGGRRVLKSEYTGRLFFVQDGSDYYAEMKTLPDFGCVQHEDARGYLK